MLDARTQTETARGYIALVQEARFRLTTDQGQSFLLTLAHDASATPTDLVRFLDEQTHVEVAYSGQPGLDSGVAHAVRGL